MATKRNSDDRVKIEIQVPVTTLKRLLIWGWIEGQSRSELAANTIAAIAEANEPQFMADLAKRAKDKGMTLDELEAQIYEDAGLVFHAASEPSSLNEGKTENGV